METLVEPGSFVWGFVTGAAFTFMGIMAWALCASAKMADERSDSAPRSLPGERARESEHLDAEARSYEFTEYNVPDRDLPWAS